MNHTEFKQKVKKGSEHEKER